MMISVLNHRGRCRRCGGNLTHQRDEFGDYVQCLQCSRTTHVGPPAHHQASGRQQNPGFGLRIKLALPEPPVGGIAMA